MAQSNSLTGIMSDTVNYWQQQQQPEEICRQFVPQVVQHALQAQEDRTEISSSDLNQEVAAYSASREIQQSVDVQNVSLSIGEFNQFIGSENVNLGCTTQYISTGPDKQQSSRKSREISLNKDILETFVETRAFSATLENLSNGRTVVIIGNTGDGKTTIAVKALSKFIDQTKQSDKAWKPFIIGNANEFNQFIKDNNLSNCIVFIDNIFGISNYSRAQYDDWCSLFERMNLLSNKQPLLLVALRKHIYLECQTEMKKYKPFNEAQIVDLSEDYKLTRKEKHEILEKHVQSSTFCSIVANAGAKSLRLTKEELRNIVKCDGALGFPLCCKLFTSDVSIFLRGIKFFEKPVEYLMQVVSNLKDNDEKKYATLLFILLSPDRRLNPNDLEDVLDGSPKDIKKRMKMISQICGIKVFVRTILGEAKRMNGHLLREDNDGCFIFAHESIQETVCLSFGIDFPKQALKICDTSFLCDYVRTEACALPNEIVILLRKSHLPVLVERVVKEIMLGNFRDICQHGMFIDSTFIKLFFEFSRRENILNEIISTILSDGSTFFGKALTTFPIQTQFVKEILKILQTGAFSEKCKDIFDSKELYDAMATTCAGGEVDIYRLLLERNVRLHPACLVAASSNGSVDIMYDLLDRHGYNPDTKVPWKGKARIALMEAIKSKKTEAVELLIRNKADVNILDKNCRTALHVAVLENNETMLQILLKEPVDPNTKDVDGMTPLLYAAQNGLENCVKILVKSSASVNMADSEKKTPLHFAIESGQYDITNVLLSSGAVVNKRDNLDQTPLHIAAQNGNVKLAELLLNCQASFDFPDCTGDTALHIATVNGSIPCVQLLLAYGASVNTQDGNDKSALHRSVYGRNIDMVTYLTENGADINQKDRAGSTPLHISVQCENEDIMLYLLSKGSDVNSKDNQGKTPLLVAAEFGHERMILHLIDNGAYMSTVDNKLQTALHKAVDKGEFEAVESLLDCAFGVNDQDIEGLTPLHLGCMRDYGDITELILSIENLELNSIDKFERTPLSFATEKGSFFISEKLIQRGADANIADRNGNYPMHFAVRNGHLPIVKMLFQQNDVCLNATECKNLINISLENRRIDVMEYLLELFPKTLNELIDDEQTLLHRTSREGLVEATNILLKRGASVSVIDRHSNSPLHVSSQNCFYEISDKLLKNGAFINLQNELGQTPVILAISNKHCQLLFVQYLVNNGADLHQTDHQGNTIFHYCCAIGNAKVFDFLIKRATSLLLCVNQQNWTGLHFACLCGHSSVVGEIMNYIDENQNAITNFESLFALVQQGRQFERDWCEIPELNGLLVQFSEMDKYKEIDDRLGTCYKIKYYS